MVADDVWMGKLHELDRAAWSLAAIVSALRDGEPTARSVLEALGLGSLNDEHGQVAAMAAAPLLQASRFIVGGSSWDQQDDEALLSQGRGSAAAGRVLPERLLPQLPDGQRLLSEPVRMLDVGVGVAAMAVALCQNMPHLSVVGLDVLARPLELAGENVRDAGLQNRIELRQLNVAQLTDEAAFDLAWLPAPFIPRDALEAGLPNVVRATVPGGWVLLGHGRFGDDRWDNAITRFKTVAYGGTPLDDAEAAQLLQSVGLRDVGHLESPAGAPAFCAGRRA